MSAHDSSKSVFQFFKVPAVTPLLLSPKKILPMPAILVHVPPKPVKLCMRSRSCMFSCSPSALTVVRKTFRTAEFRTKKVCELRCCLVEGKGYVFARSYSGLYRRTWEDIARLAGWTLEETQSRDKGPLPFWVPFTEKHPEAKESLSKVMCRRADMPAEPCRPRGKPSYFQVATIPGSVSMSVASSPAMESSDEDSGFLEGAFAAGSAMCFTNTSDSPSDPRFTNTSDPHMFTPPPDIVINTEQSVVANALTPPRVVRLSPIKGHVIPHSGAVRLPPMQSTHSPTTEPMPSPFAARGLCFESFATRLQQTAAGVNADAPPDPTAMPKRAPKKHTPTLSAVVMPSFSPVPMPFVGVTDSECVGWILGLKNYNVALVQLKELIIKLLPAYMKTQVVDASLKLDPSGEQVVRKLQNLGPSYVTSAFNKLFFDSECSWRAEPISTVYLTRHAMHLERAYSQMMLYMLPKVVTAEVYDIRMGSLIAFMRCRGGLGTEGHFFWNTQDPAVALNPAIGSIIAGYESKYVVDDKLLDSLHWLESHREIAMHTSRYDHTDPATHALLFVAVLLSEYTNLRSKNPQDLESARIAIEAVTVDRMSAHMANVSFLRRYIAVLGHACLTLQDMCVKVTDANEKVTDAHECPPWPHFMWRRGKDNWSETLSMHGRAPSVSKKQGLYYAPTSPTETVGVQRTIDGIQSIALSGHFITLEPHDMNVDKLTTQTMYAVNKKLKARLQKDNHVLQTMYRNVGAGESPNLAGVLRTVGRNMGRILYDAGHLTNELYHFWPCPQMPLARFAAEAFQ